MTPRDDHRHAWEERQVNAEPLLLEGYAGLKKHEALIPKGASYCLTEALERLVQLYDSWGQPEKTAKWRQKLSRPPKQ